MSFKFLKSFKIASLPSLHIDTLCRDDFWDSLPMLETVSLAVVPDWRRVKECGAEIEDVQVYPTDAIPKVMRLLGSHIGKRENIKRLHFEWICGGELASGSCQRNKHVLPAPFLRNHRKIADSRLENLMILPHIKHLSLKNCWFTPHTFYRIIYEMASTTLVSLELETVSLSGPPPKVGYADPGPVPTTAPNPPAPGGPIGPVATAPMGPLASMAPPDFAHQFLLSGVDPALANYDAQLTFITDQAVVSPPDLSWPHIIDLLTTGPTIREFIHSRDNPLGPALKLKKVLKLEKMSFKSCGYVEVPDGRFIASWPFGTKFGEHVERTSRRIEQDCSCIYFFMQVNTDRHLARVIEGIPMAEAMTLRRVHGFTFGWENDSVYDELVIDAAKNDGVKSPGRGRFTGTVEGKPAEIAPDKRYENIFYPEEKTSSEAEKDVIVPFFNTARFDRDYDDDAPGVFDQSLFEKGAGYRSPSDDTAELRYVIRRMPPF